MPTRPRLSCRALQTPVSHLVTHNEAGPQASHQLNPALVKFGTSWFCVLVRRGAVSVAVLRGRPALAVQRHVGGARARSARGRCRRRRQPRGRRRTHDRPVVQSRRAPRQRLARPPATRLHQEQLQSRCTVVFQRSRRRGRHEASWLHRRRRATYRLRRRSLRSAPFLSVQQVGV